MSKTTYNKIRTIVNKRLKDGSLPKQYKFPAYDYFEPMFKNLKPQEKRIPEFEYVFVPQGLTFNQWDKLLKKTCNGAWYSSYIPKDLNKGSGWKLWLISGGTGENNISKEQVEQRGDVLPTMQALQAQQWLRLEQGKEPVDIQTWSMARENVEVVGVLKSVFMYFYPGDRTVDSYWDNRDSAYDYIVVRASGESDTLALEPPSAAPLELEITELVVNGKTYVLKESKG